MVTRAQVQIKDGNRAVLQQDDRELVLHVLAPVDVKLEIFETERPPAEYDAPNPGSRMIGFKVALDPCGRKVATHSWGAGGSLMQNIHAGFAAPNTIILEVAPAFGPLHQDIMGDAFILRDGYVYPPPVPGLGITLTEDTKRRFPFVPGSGEYNSVPGKTLPEERGDWHDECAD